MKPAPIPAPSVSNPPAAKGAGALSLPALDSWHVAYSPKHGEPFVTNATGKLIICQTFPGATFAESDANARLAAAAPDMARVLWALVCKVEGLAAYSHGNTAALCNEARGLLGYPPVVGETPDAQATPAPGLGELAWVAQRFLGIRHPNGGKWSRAETERSFADLERNARAALELAGFDVPAAAKSDARAMQTVTADDLPVTANASAVLDALAADLNAQRTKSGPHATGLRRRFTARRGYGGKHAAGQWLRVTARPSEVRAALARVTGQGGAR